jgi:hypothetical protein
MGVEELLNNNFADSALSPNISFLSGFVNQVCKEVDGRAGVDSGTPGLRNSGTPETREADSY